MLKMENSYLIWGLCPHAYLTYVNRVCESSSMVLNVSTPPTEALPSPTVKKYATFLNYSG